MARKYRVLSRNPTLGHEHGEVFTLDNKRLAEELETRGAIEKVKRGEEDEKKDKDDGGS